MTKAHAFIICILDNVAKVLSLPHLLLGIMKVELNDEEATSLLRGCVLVIMNKLT